MAGTTDLALYHYEGCPYCAVVRREIARLALDIELRDIQRDRAHRVALIEGGGMPQVPCLRIAGAAGDVQWLYESQDIVAYLRQRRADVD